MLLLACLTALGVLALAFIAPAFSQDKLDSVKVDPTHHKVEFENDQVRIVRWSIAPGDKTGNHSHPHNLNIPLTDYFAKVATPDGKTDEVRFKAGSATWRESGIHIVENLGNQPMTGILIEPKKPSSSRPAGTHDAIAADPKHSTLLFENEQLRVIRERLAPGEKAPMHGHPDNVQVLLTDTKANIITADGKTALKVGKAGDVAWRPATQHAGENIGDEALEQIVVEMKGMRGE